MAGAGDEENGLATFNRRVGMTTSGLKVLHHAGIIEEEIFQAADEKRRRDYRGSESYSAYS